MKKIILMFIAFLLFSGNAFGWNYPKDGRFKQLHPNRDSWYFIDGRWDLQAPDKWQHFQGFLWSQQIGQKYFNKYLVAATILSLGLYKEYEDAYREGWSARDILCDVGGILAGMYGRNKIYCNWNNKEKNIKITYNLGF